jgi:hypothetical protein
MYAAVPRIIPIAVIAGDVIVGDIDDARRRRATGSERFREAEVEHLHRAVGRTLNVRWFQVAVE